MNFRKIFTLASLVTGFGVLLAAHIAHAQAQTQAPPTHSGDRSESVTVEDTTRTYLVHLPASYDAKKKYPVVLILHDTDNDAGDMARISRFNQTADQYGIIAVYPNALHERWATTEQQQQQQQPTRGYGRHGGMGGGYPGGGGGGYPGGGGGYPGGHGGGGQGASRQSANELAFFNAMLDQLPTEYSIDEDRVFATGFADGGLMDFQLGCNMGNRIAAIAPVGAELPKSMEQPCKNWSFRPVPLLMINGTADPVLPYKGRSSGGGATLGVEDTAKTWAKTDGCGSKPEETSIPPHANGGLTTKVSTWGDCTQGSAVITYSIVDGGHFWPGGEAPYVPANKIGKTSDDLTADEVIWKFFDSHPMAASK
jgi:polyhydroxybutyrate depolymerase